MNERKKTWESQENPPDFSFLDWPSCCLDIFLSYYTLYPTYCYKTSYFAPISEIVELSQYKNRVYCKSASCFRWYKVRTGESLNRASKNVCYPPNEWHVQPPAPNHRGISNFFVIKSHLYVTYQKQKFALYKLPFHIGDLSASGILRMQRSKCQLYVFVQHPYSLTSVSLLIYPVAWSRDITLKTPIPHTKKIDFTAYGFNVEVWTILQDFLLHLHGEELHIFDLSAELPILTRVVSLPIVNDHATFNCVYGCGEVLYVTEDDRIDRIGFGKY